ncbi:MAG: hypothetical protein OXF07_15775, partial [Rhodobacter sp.]|nr:hypothetical protein [Rhodobacter sp.]
WGSLWRQTDPKPPLAPVISNFLNMSFPSCLMGERGCPETHAPYRAYSFSGSVGLTGNVSMR